MAEGSITSLNFPGGVVGVVEGATVSQQALLTIDVAAVEAAEDIRHLNIGGGTVAIAPHPDYDDAYAIVTISAEDADGLTWKRLNWGGGTLSQAYVDALAAYALIVISVADADTGDFSTLNWNGATLTIVEIATGYYAPLMLGLDDVDGEVLSPVNVSGRTLTLAAVTGGSALLSGGGASAPENTLAPAITTTAVIGTQIDGDDGTWTNPQAFTYQWQRNTGNWGDIGGATSKNYTPVDADFGYTLRLVVTSGGVSANSNATNVTQEAPVQTLSAELVANNDFSTYSGGFTNWTLSPGTYGGDPGVSQVDPSGGAGTGAAKFSSTGSLALLGVNTSPLATVGAYYESLVEMSARASGSVTWRDSNGVFQRSLAAVGAGRDLVRNTSAGNPMNLRNSGATDATIDRVSVKQVTLNGELVAPSANMRISQFYTLPSSPIIGDEIRVVVRSSDFSSGNYWLVLLTYTGSAWNINLYSVATHTRTSRISAAGIGSSNGIRITANGNDWTLETTANGGSNWTSRGTVNNSTYNTATGVNVLATSPFTLSNMQYEAA